MTAPVHPPTGLDDRLRELIDRSDLEQLVHRHFQSPDDHRTDPVWLASVYADDFVIELPHGTFTGPAGLRGALVAGAALFERSHHVVTNLVTTVDGDTATAVAKLIATHLVRAAEPHNAFTAGADYRFRMRRTPDGWRLTEARFGVVWTRGEAPDRR